MQLILSAVADRHHLTEGRPRKDSRSVGGPAQWRTNAMRTPWSLTYSLVSQNVKDRYQRGEYRGRTDDLLHAMQAL